MQCVVVADMQLDPVIRLVRESPRPTRRNWCTRREGVSPRPLGFMVEVCETRGRDLSDAIRHGASKRRVALARLGPTADIATRNRRRGVAVYPDVGAVACVAGKRSRVVGRAWARAHVVTFLGANQGARVFATGFVAAKLHGRLPLAPHRSRRWGGHPHTSPHRVAVEAAQTGRHAAQTCHSSREPCGAPGQSARPKGYEWREGLRPQVSAER